MRDIEELLALAREDSESVFFPPVGLPKPKAGNVLPQDIETFYSLCGGAILFEDDNFPMPLVKPSEFVLANPRLLIGASLALLEDARNGITSSWYILSTWNGTEHVCINCHPLRLGRCYYTSSYTYAMEGQSPIIAMSFTEFFVKVLGNKGKEEPYWEMPSFTTYGDAYNEV